MGARDGQGGLVHHLAKGAMGFVGLAVTAAIHVPHFFHRANRSLGHRGPMAKAAGGEGEQQPHDEDRSVQDREH